jgi:SAM-dependent methyltransferase
VVSITAYRRGAKVSGLDLSPVLLEQARKNAAILDADIDFREGDVEALPYENARFDVVLSQFGHMFAPRPEIALSEMMRALKPGGRIAFSTWPPELMIGQIFALTVQHVPPPPGVAPPGQWGEPGIVRERLSGLARDIEFNRDDMKFPCLSPQHYRANLEMTAGPVIKAVEMLSGQPEKLARFRSEVESVAAQYFPTTSCTSRS